MSINAFLRLLSEHYFALLIYFTGLPLLTCLVVHFYKTSPIRQKRDYILSILIYLAAIPGILSALLVFYSLFIIRQNLLEANILLYFLPLLSMGLVFYFIGRKVEFDRLPGFGRLSGLMLMLTLVCIVLFFLYRLHFIVGFFGSLQGLFITGLIIFVLFKFAASKLFGHR